MYITDKKTWIHIFSFLMKSFRDSSSAVLDDGRMGLRVDADPELFQRIVSCAAGEGAVGQSACAELAQFEYVPEPEYPFRSEPLHTYVVSEDLASYVGEVGARYLYDVAIDHAAVRINADSETFAKIAARAYCEKLSANSGVHYVTLEENSNKSYINFLFEGLRSFSVVPIQVDALKLFVEVTESHS